MVEPEALAAGRLGLVDWKVLRECLSRARSDEGLTLDELATKSGVDRSTIHRIENTKKRIKHNPDLETIEALVVRGMSRTLSAFFEQLERSQNPPLNAVPEPAHDQGATGSPRSGHVVAPVPASTPVTITTEGLAQLGRDIGRVVAETIRDTEADRSASSDGPRKSKRPAVRRRARS